MLHPIKRLATVGLLLIAWNAWAVPVGSSFTGSGDIESTATGIQLIGGTEVTSASGFVFPGTGTSMFSNSPEISTGIGDVGEVVVSSLDGSFNVVTHLTMAVRTLSVSFTDIVLAGMFQDGDGYNAVTITGVGGPIFDGTTGWLDWTATVHCLGSSCDQYNLISELPQATAPEPASFLLLALGLAGVGMRRKVA